MSIKEFSGLLRVCQLVVSLLYHVRDTLVDIMTYCMGNLDTNMTYSINYFMYSIS